MKRLITGLFLVVGMYSWGQVDTLEVKDLRDAANIVFSHLDTSYYKGALINRSFSSSEIINEQLIGNYNQVHSINDFFELYQDLQISYVDSNYLMSNDSMVKFVEEVFITNELENLDKLIQPFGFILHNISYIDSSKINNNYFLQSEFNLIPTGTESDYYKNKILKSGALLEFYPESGYKTGALQYVKELVTTSRDIKKLELQINLGNGFLPFNEFNNLIEYDRTRDSLIGTVAFSYELDNEQKYDTVHFYLTTKGEKNVEKSNHPRFYWEFVGEYTNSTSIKFEVGMIRGCNNTSLNPRRPVIFIPPYRPTVQPFSMQKYFDQFNVDGLFEKLEKKGYDVYFIKLKPGNKSLETSAQAVQEYITLLNSLKVQEYPDEMWENIVVGYSMGGQIGRYCLKKMEYDHMTYGAPHHHTRLYIPFDSPHLGANIPMFTQVVYSDLKNSNIFAGFAYAALNDEASRDMSVAHINGSLISIEQGGSGNPDIYHISPGATNDRDNFMNALYFSFNHTFSITSDLRRTFPSFTRNISVSTGSNSKDYTELFSLDPGKLLFYQDAIGYNYGFHAYKLRRVYASKRVYDHTIFRNKEQIVSFLVPITYRNRDYRVYYADEWDMAQGGYKDEFYDKFGTGVVSILRLGAYGLGHKYYNNHMSFLPMVSALSINKNIWQLGNLYYNLKDEGLMYNIFNFNPLTDKSDTFGYPNLGHPTDHFQISPFEAIYCDPQTYEHIKLEESVAENEGDANNDNTAYLSYFTQFILDEVEANDVYLQNKIIGKNHVQWDPNYVYKAWYKAKKTLTIGMEVTPKTDIGAYVIEATGDITTYAGQEISIKPGFHVQQGAVYHAYIAYDECPDESGRGEVTSTSSQNASEWQIGTIDDVDWIRVNSIEQDIMIYPNPTRGEVTINIPGDLSGWLTVFSSIGEQIHQQTVLSGDKINIDLAKGHYLFQLKLADGSIKTKQIIVL